MNNKILSVVLVLWIASTGFAGLSSANSGSILGKANTTLEQWAEKKMKSWSYFGKRKGLKNLTDEEKTSLESMSDEEKQAFFTAKKQERKAQKEARKAVVDKLVAWESLTAAEEAIRLEALAKIEDNTRKKTKPGADIIAKILAGDELSEAEQIDFAQMQEKRAEREAQRALLEPIKAKVKAGEELTADEQALLKEYKGERKGKKGHGKRGGEGKGERGEK